jgi:hypothetical protein
VRAEEVVKQVGSHEELEKTSEGLERVQVVDSEVAVVEEEEHQMAAAMEVPVETWAGKAPVH